MCLFMESTNDLISLLTNASPSTSVVRRYFEPRFAFTQIATSGIHAVLTGMTATIATLALIDICIKSNDDYLKSSVSGKKLNHPILLRSYGVTIILTATI